MHLSELVRHLVREVHLAGERAGVDHVLCDRVRVGRLMIVRDVGDERGGVLVSVPNGRAHLVGHGRHIACERFNAMVLDTTHYGMNNCLFILYFFLFITFSIQRGCIRERTRNAICIVLNKAGRLPIRKSKE